MDVAILESPLLPWVFPHPTTFFACAGVSRRSPDLAVHQAPEVTGCALLSRSARRHADPQVKTRNSVGLLAFPLVAREPEGSVWILPDAPLTASPESSSTTRDSTRDSLDIPSFAGRGCSAQSFETRPPSLRENMESRKLRRPPEGDLPRGPDVLVGFTPERAPRASATQRTVWMDVPSRFRRSRRVRDLARASGCEARYTATIHADLRGSGVRVRKGFRGSSDFEHHETRRGRWSRGPLGEGRR